MADIRGILAEIDPSHTVDDLTLSAHHSTIGRNKDRVPLLEDGGWRSIIREREEHRFFKEWRARLDSYDAFICFYPPAFALLYRFFDKPIICQFPIRYEYPCHADAEQWRQFNDYLTEGVDSGRIRLAANNPYDAAYGSLFLDRPVPFVPSLCEYTRATWQPRHDGIVYYCTRRIEELESAGGFIHKAAALPRGHTWADVARCKAIVHFPYNVSTMSMIEQYTMGVPLLVPTRDYAVSLYERGAPLFAQNSWAATEGLAPGSVIEPPRGFPGGHDPNDFGSIEALRWWLRYADYYDVRSMPGLTFFGSLEELCGFAREGMNFFEDASARRRSFYDARRALALDGWREMIAAIA
jgi:hypothetical protein